MKTLKVIVRSVLWETYETEVEEDFGLDEDTVFGEVTDLYYEEGYTWARSDSSIHDESVEEYELLES